MGAQLHAGAYPQPVHSTLTISGYQLLLAQYEHARGSTYQHNTKNYIKVTHEHPDTASVSPKLHLTAPLHEPTHHVQIYSLTISQGTTQSYLCSCAVAGPLPRSVLHLPLGLARMGLQMNLQGCACEARRRGRHCEHL